MVMTLDHQEHRGRAKSHTASESPGSNIWVVLGQIFAYFIFVTTITTAGCVKKLVKCKIFQWIRERNCFDIAQNV